ncbi:MAG: FecR domain-containing protein [Cellvibrionaceae bacterium]|nr:FecR domain-containing protein [Cellvibrionaceae bacterium]
MPLANLRPKLALCALALALSSSPAAAEQYWVYSMVDGDNLWDFSAKHLDKVTRFEQLRRINNIQSPTQLRPGALIRVPMSWVTSNLVPARIHAIKGAAELERASGGEREVVTAATEIRLGDTLRTGANSSIAVRFADKSVVTINEDSVIRFDHLSAHGSTGMVDSRIKLLKGRLSSTVTPAKGPGSRFEIHTPSAISAVRGTAYRAVVAEGEVSNIEVVEGKVAVAGGKAQELVPSGFGTQVKAGAAPTKPKPLLPAPQLVAPSKAIRKISERLSWPAVAGAKAYRGRISEGADFTTVLWQKVSEQPKLALPDLPDGDYFLRLRAIDSIGLEGLEQQVRFSLDARPQPPMPMQPQDDALLRGDGPQLKWTASADAERYQLEVASDAQFKQLLANETLAATEFDTASLPKFGKFYWRLSSIAADGEVGPLGAVRQYEVKPLPPIPEASVSTGDDGKYVLSWPQTGEGERYRVQLAVDKNFKELVLNEVIDENRFAMQPYTAAGRYLRVQTIEADGFEGAWGASQYIEPLPDQRPWYFIVGMILIGLL